jgi:hypothetical protein
MERHYQNPILWISSPRASESFKNYFYKEAMSCQLVMPIWSIDEACQTVEMYNLDEDRVKDLFSMYGGIPRFFLSSNDGVLQGTPISQALNDRIEVCNLLSSQGKPSKNFPASHTLFHILLPDNESLDEADEEVQSLDEADEAAQSLDEADEAVQSPDEADEEVHFDGDRQTPNSYSFHNHFMGVASNYIFEELVKNYHEVLLKSILEAVDTTDDCSFKGRMYEQYHTPFQELIK